MSATRLPTCDVDEAPSLPGTLRVTAIYENGEGDSIYFDPAILPEHMREMDNRDSRNWEMAGLAYPTASAISSWEWQAIHMLKAVSRSSAMAISAT